MGDDGGSLVGWWPVALEVERGLVEWGIETLPTGRRKALRRGFKLDEIRAREENQPISGTDMLAGMGSHQGNAEVKTGWRIDPGLVHVDITAMWYVVVRGKVHQSTRSIFRRRDCTLIPIRYNAAYHASLSHH